jgi:predicted metal-dependent hydrolase
MSVQSGLEIVVPRSYDLRKVPEIVESKRLWIERMRKRFAGISAPQPMEVRPKEIVFPAISETWRIEYHSTSSRSVTLRQVAPLQLEVTGHIESDLACRRLLQRWLIARARAVLLPWLCRVSEEVQLPFSTSTVRLQRSRWGSCSRRKTVSLNARLLFLTPDLVRYLFIHELCHTVQLNHSARYWALVESKEPNYGALDKQMRHAMRRVPTWA